MKKLFIILSIVLTSSLASASCVKSYQEASKGFIDLDGKFEESFMTYSGAASIDALLIGGNAYAIPVFTISVAGVSISVSVDEWLKKDMAKVEKIIREAKIGAYSSDMEDLHQFVEEYSGYDVTKKQLQQTIVELDAKNSFCTNEVQGIDDVKFNIVRNLIL